MINFVNVIYKRSLFYYRKESINMVRKIKIKEEFKSNKWEAFLWPAYLDDVYTCSCCHRKFPAGHNTIYLDGYEPDGMHFIYAYTDDNRIGNSVDYDPYNLPKEDSEGGIFNVVVANTDDEEGYEWRNFCRNCWPKLTKYTPEEIADMY